MCRNIKTLHDSEPPATEDEILASATQYVRKISGSSKPSQANTEAFDKVASSSEWRSEYLDYLHLAFTNATAFSPTDVMPLSHRAKFTMVLQSTVSLALVALVVARSVNAFT